MWREPASGEGVVIRGDRRDREGDALIFALETSCDETAAAVVTREGSVLSSVVSSQADLHARYGGVVPEIRLAAPSRARDPGRAGGARRGRSDARRGRAGCGDHGPRPRGGVARGPLCCEGARVGTAATARPRRPPRGPCRLLYIADPLEPPFVCYSRAGAHDAPRRARAGSSHRLGTTLDDAAGEAFDKEPVCSGSGTRAVPRSTDSRARATPRRSRSRLPGCPGSTSRSPG